MAGVRWYDSSPTTALVAATAKTVLQLIAAANVRERITMIEITFDGTTSTAVPVVVRVLRQTTAIGGTPTANNPGKVINSDSETLQVTGQVYGTSPTEPTASTVVRRFHIHPQAGRAEQLPIGRELYIVGGDRLGIEVTAPAAVNCIVSVEGEE